MSTKRVADVARPILSANKQEARSRALRLYKCWYRAIDFIAVYYRLDLPLTKNQMRKKLRDEFDKNRHHTDLRIIDLIIFKGQNDLREVNALWFQQCHIMGSWFKDTLNPKRASFLAKFFSGSD